ncbi:hypothetical protein F5144DRAFT_88771 [Chaetomium tenue]|uniref:Uncharacterized protein n=1 Tax=Chaetomium tenue TaxID=1854479 RepID=A0ACB7PGS2_9PEZI|nr:hypothetical protein F5144DRAFT_88771 [Chaetomium globosum]
MQSAHDSSESHIDPPRTGFRESMTGAQIPIYTTRTTGTPKPSMPPDVQKVFDSALDDRLYKTWIDEFGDKIPTAGALLPVGYKLSDDPAFPWVCPVRSCEKMLSSLNGLGRHFCVSEPAVFVHS